MYNRPIDLPRVAKLSKQTRKHNPEYWGEITDKIFSIL